MEPSSGSSFSHPEGQESTKFALDAASPDSFLEPGRPLPETYNENCLVVMARDPLCIFAYWDATPDRFQSLREQVGEALWQKGHAILRVYDVTGVDGDVSRAHRSFDVKVNFDARRGYIKTPEPGRTYFVELGFAFPDGRFMVLVGSNRVTLPRGTVSNETDSRWLIVNVKEWEKMFETSDHFAKGGSAEISKMMAQRWEFLRAVFSGSSSTLSSKAMLKEEPPR